MLVFFPLLVLCKYLYRPFFVSGTELLTATHSLIIVFGSIGGPEKGPVRGHPPKTDWLLRQPRRGDKQLLLW